MIEWRKNAFDDHEVESLTDCDLCQRPAAEARRLFQKYGLWVVQCPRCGIVYVNPRLRPSILWQRYSDEYFQNEYVPIHGEYNEQANYHWQAPLLRELSTLAPKRGRLLDIGCAIGLFLAAARLDQWEVVGNELSPFASQYAWDHFGIRVIPGKAETLDLPPGSIDAVTLWETIEHVQSPNETIRKAAQLLRPGGVLALSTPNAASLSFRCLRDRWWIIAPKEHIFYFTPKTLARLLEENGFEIKKTWTAGLDIYYLRNTMMGRVVSPLHIRAMEARTQGSPAPASGLAPKNLLFHTLWPKLKPLASKILNQFKLSDTLYVYAVRRD